MIYRTYYLPLMPNSTESILDYRVTMIMLTMMSRWTEMIIMIIRWTSTTYGKKTRSTCRQRQAFLIIVISINQCLFLKQSKPNLKLISHFGNLIFEIKLILEILGNYSVAGFEMVLNRKVNFTDTSNFTNFNQFRFKVLKKGLKKIFCSPLQSEKLFCFC